MIRLLRVLRAARWLTEVVRLAAVGVQAVLDALIAIIDRPPEPRG